MDPVLLDGISANALASFIHWFFYTWVVHLRNEILANRNSNSDHDEMGAREIDEEFLVGVLTVSRYWNIQKGEDFVRKHFIDIHPALPPSRQLELARRFQVQEWIGLAVRSLVLSPISPLKFNDIEWMTGKVFVIVAKAHDALIYERSQCAFNPP